MHGRLGSVNSRRTCLRALLAPCPFDEMICWRVSARVGNVKNNDPSLTEPIAGIV
jgi:putative SOS response-associated peptidase YedK